MKVWEDPTHPGNSSKYHTGKACTECKNPAGTLWNKDLCFECNVKRARGISEKVRIINERACNKS